MQTKIIEATNQGTHGINWGKFMLGRWDSEWKRRSAIEPADDGTHRPLPLLPEIGWGHAHLLVLDMQTGEGAVFRPGGIAKADLEKHRVWVCPLFPYFLTWLYQQDLSDLDTLPDLIDLPGAASAMLGFRHGEVSPDELDRLRRVEAAAAAIVAAYDQPRDWPDAVARNIGALRNALGR